jgi:hypothetical protein
MDRDALTRYTVDRLSVAANRDDIIRYVCQRGKLSWQAAEDLVETAEATHAREIERRHFPINFTASFMVWLFGCLVTVYAALSIFEPLLGRILPDPFYLLNDLGARYGLLPDTRQVIDNLHQSGILPDFWRTLYTQGQTYGVSHDAINALYVLVSGYLFWPFGLVGLSAMITGATEFFRNLFRLIRR